MSCRHNQRQGAFLRCFPNTIRLFICTIGSRCLSSMEVRFGVIAFEARFAGAPRRFLLRDRLRRNTGRLKIALFRTDACAGLAVDVQRSVSSACVASSLFPLSGAPVLLVILHRTELSSGYLCQGDLLTVDGHVMPTRLVNFLQLRGSSRLRTTNITCAPLSNLHDCVRHRDVYLQDVSKHEPC